jgi:hypothetical protein
MLQPIIGVFFIAKRGPRTSKVGKHGLTACHIYHGINSTPFVGIKYMDVTVIVIIIIVMIHYSSTFTFWLLPPHHCAVNPRMVFISSFFPCLCNHFRVFRPWFIHSSYFRRLVRNVIARTEFRLKLREGFCFEYHSDPSVRPFCVLPSVSKLLISVGIWNFEFRTAECPGPGGASAVWKEVPTTLNCTAVHFSRLMEWIIVSVSC